MPPGLYQLTPCPSRARQAPSHGSRGTLWGCIRAGSGPWKPHSEPSQSHQATILQRGVRRAQRSSSLAPLQPPHLCSGPHHRAKSLQTYFRHSKIQNNLY